MARTDFKTIEVPAPTASPLVLAMGCTLIFAGLLMNLSVTVLGVILTIAGCAGWLRDLVPTGHEEAVPLVAEDNEVSTERREIDRLAIAPEQLRVWLPVHTYPVSAGLKGGFAGSIAMAVLACGYGLFETGSIWYPINLLAAAVYAQSLKLGPAQLNAFHLDSFGIAVVIHVLVSALVGLLYGVMLPMFPRRPILLGGLVVPVLWSGMLHPVLNLLNPLLADRIDWFWFIASQVAFGVVAGLVVVRQSPMPTLENVAFALRAGVEAPGAMSPGGDAAMKHVSWLSASTILVGALVVGCSAPSGQPRAESIAAAPNELVAFDELYANNCAGCHGVNGRGGAALALANPEYLAIVDRHAMRSAVAGGVRGTSMPAFAQRAGGMLTEQQIDALVDGMRSRWTRRDALGGAIPPPYAPTSPGDVRRGAAAYRTYCRWCHGEDGRGGSKGSAITDDSFLALASDQGLRTTVIAGRPELGAPDWRGDLEGRPIARGLSAAMSDQEVTDVVSWLASRRVAAPGQPYASEHSASGGFHVE